MSQDIGFGMLLASNIFMFAMFYTYARKAQRYQNYITDSGSFQKYAEWWDKNQKEKSRITNKGW